MEATLWNQVERLAPLAPRFVSVTYGADGSTRERTHNVVTRIQRETPLVGAPHLTCIGASRARFSTSRESIGTRESAIWLRFVAILHGGKLSMCRTRRLCVRVGPGGCLKSVADFDISVCCVPGSTSGSIFGECRFGQPQAQVGCRRRRATSRNSSTTGCISALPRSLQKPLESSRRSCRESCRSPASAGVEVRGHVRCDGADWLKERFNGLDDDPETRRLIAASVAIEQVQQLARQGVRDFHFYTLNRAELTYAICHALGVRPPGSGRLP